MPERSEAIVPFIEIRGQKEAKEDCGFKVVICSRGQLRKMLVPDPAHLVRSIVLILRQPEFTLLPDHVEDLRL